MHEFDYYFRTVLCVGHLTWAHSAVVPGNIELAPEGKPHPPPRRGGAGLGVHSNLLDT